MKNIYAIIRLAAAYKGKLFFNILFNNIGVVFSIFSLALLIPVLDIFFKYDVAHFQALAKGSAPILEFSKESASSYLNYQVAKLVAEGGKETALIYMCAFLLTMILLKNLFHYLGMVFISMIANGVVRDLRNKLYEKISKIHLGFFSKEKKGDLLSRMTSDMKEIEWGILGSVEAGFKAPFEILGNIVFLFLLSSKLTLFIIIFLPISGALISFIGRSLRHTSTKGQEKMGELLSMSEETIGGMKVIKAFNAADFLIDKFRAKNQEYYKTMIRLYRRSDLASPTSEFLGVAATAVLLWYGGNLVFKNELEASVFIVYLMLFAQLINPFKALSKAFYGAQRALASLERINEVVHAKVDIQQSSNPVRVNEFKEAIEFHGVSFTYGNGPVLKNLNLKIPRGKTVALVGQSGAGKTTIADLIPRFYDVTEGRITIDGLDIKNIHMDDLTHLMGIVTQESILFNDTILNNIIFGMKGVGESDVIEAAKSANAHEFIIRMEEGYHTQIGDRGGRLSGGQRQRLSIARALLKNPSILILDEATSALDTESERLVQDAIQNLMKNRTAIVIAHRLSTIQHADLIVVLQHGEIVETGKHQELIAQNGVYKKLTDLQAFN